MGSALNALTIDADYRSEIGYLVNLSNQISPFTTVNVSANGIAQHGRWSGNRWTPWMNRAGAGGFGHTGK